MSLETRPVPNRMVQVAWQVPAACALAVLATVGVGVREELIGFLYLAAVTPELCRRDLVDRRLPNALVVPGSAVAALGLAFGWLHTGQVPLGALIAGAATFVFLLMLSLGGGMGMGDVKLGGLLALNLGVLGVMAALAGPVLGFVAGGVAGLVALLLPGSGLLRRIPFGPYLLLGFWAAVALPLLTTIARPLSPASL